MIRLVPTAVTAIKREMKGPLRGTEH